MSAVAAAYSTLRYFTPGNSRDPSRDSPPSFLKVSVLGFRARKPPVLSRKYDEIRKNRLGALTPEKSLRELDESTVSVQLEPISGEAHFDRVVADEQSFIVVWMATWCRKCIYLKPKLEKTAAEYYPRLRFYSIDVNSVPHKLVTRADVTKMPTIQLWRNGKKQAEVIGGHGKAYLVINEVHAMIESE